MWGFETLVIGNATGREFIPGFEKYFPHLWVSKLFDD
jgi:hypothetical protein